MTNSSPWLDEALHALLVDRQRSLRDLLTAYDALEEQAVRSLSEGPNSQRIVDVKRELASLRLTATKQRGGTALEAWDLFTRCECPGYASAEARLIVAGTFARICLADGHPELDRGELDEALLSVPKGRYPGVEELARTLNAAKQPS